MNQKENIKIVSLFIKELIREKNIKKIIVSIICKTDDDIKKNLYILFILVSFGGVVFSKILSDERVLSSSNGDLFFIAILHILIIVF